MLAQGPSPAQAAPLAIGDDATLDFALPVHPVTVTVLEESDQPVKGAGLQGPATSSSRRPPTTAATPSPTLRA